MTLLIGIVLCGHASAAATAEPPSSSIEPAIGSAKPVATTTIKRCPEGYELVTRANGRVSCAKDVIPPNE